MGTQLSLKLSDEMFSAAERYSELHGFNNIQDFIRELLREKIFEGEAGSLRGIYTYLASEKSLARNWLTKGEDEAWAHLQKGT